MKINGVQFHDRPTQRIYQVYDADKFCVGAWSSIGLEHALCALAQAPRGEMVISDEYQGRGRWMGHVVRLVVATQPGTGRAA